MAHMRDEKPFFSRQEKLHDQKQTGQNLLLWLGAGKNSEMFKLHAFQEFWCVSETKSVKMFVL